MKLNKTLKTIIACGGFLFVCVFISFKAHAEEIGNYSLPYNVANFTNMNSAMMDNVELAIQYYNTINNNPSYDSILVWSTDGIINGYYAYIYTIMVNPYCEEDYPSDYDFSLYRVRIKSNTVITNIYISYDSLQHTGTTVTGYVADLLGVPQTINYTNGDFTANYPFYYDGDPILDASGDEVIISRVSPVIVSGSAVAPSFGAGAGTNGSDFLGTGADFGASLSQATMPQAPTYNTFNFNTYNPPTFDDSSILDALDSIAQILIYTGNYIVSNILGAFSTLMQNIIKIGEYIVGVLEYIGRSIITNIQNAVQNLYENFVSLLEPLFDLVSTIKEKFEYITEPFDKDEFFHQVDGNHLITACIHIEDYGQQMKSILTNAQERNTFHLNITYPKPDGTSFQTMISFDWLYPLRHLYMPYLWVFTILYLFFSACRLLGYVIGGKS